MEFSSIKHNSKTYILIAKSPKNVDKGQPQTSKPSVKKKAKKTEKVEKQPNIYTCGMFFML